MLLHFQEQKMALALQCYDLVDIHLKALSAKVEHLQEEFEVPTCLYSTPAIAAQLFEIPTLADRGRLWLG